MHNDPHGASAADLPTGRMRKIAAMATLVAIGAVLHRLEALLPLPAPWIKLGLANIPTLLAVIFFGFRDAFAITLARVIIGSLFSGSFLSPAFFLSLLGGMGSVSAMSLSRRWLYPAISPIGISVIGSCAHTLVIFVCVYATFIRQQGFLAVLPLFLLFALGSGLLTGWLASALAARLTPEQILAKQNTADAPAINV